LLIEGERIVGITDKDIPAHAQRIDVSGRYIIPGLMDANVHLFVCITPPSSFGMTVSTSAHRGSGSGHLEKRPATVFDTWGPRQALTRTRDRINRGEIPGSRIFCAGNIIGLGGPTSPDFFPQSRAVMSKAKADAIDAQWEQGVGADLLWMAPEQVRQKIRPI